MSEWKQSANKRRDQRRTAVPVIRPPGGSKRNTKKWCRGVAGRAHVPVCMDYNDLKHTTYAPDWKTLVCKVCGKELDHYWPSRWHRSKKPPPAWVTNT